MRNRSGRPSARPRAMTSSVVYIPRGEGTGAVTIDGAVATQSSDRLEVLRTMPPSTDWATA